MNSRLKILYIGIGLTILLSLVILAFYRVPKPDYEIRKVIFAHS